MMQRQLAENIRQDFSLSVHGRAELLVIFKSNDASSIMAAGRLHKKRNLILKYGCLETRRAQAQLPATFISSFSLSSFICKSSVDLYIYLKSVDLFSKNVIP